MKEINNIRQLEQQFIGNVKELAELIEQKELDFDLLKNIIRDYLADWRDKISKTPVPMRYHFCIFLNQLVVHSSVFNLHRSLRDIIHNKIWKSFERLEQAYQQALGDS